MALVGPSHPHPSVPAAGAILPTVATVLLRYGVSELDAMLSVGHPSWVPSVRPPSLSWGFLPDSGFSRPEPGSWLCLVLTSQSQVTCQSSSLTLCPLFCRRGGVTVFLFSGVIMKTALACGPRLAQRTGRAVPSCPFPALSRCPAELGTSAQLLGPAWGECHACSVCTHPGYFRDVHIDSMLSPTMLPQALGTLVPYLEYFWGDLRETTVRPGQAKDSQAEVGFFWRPARFGDKGGPETLILRTPLLSCPMEALGCQWEKAWCLGQTAAALLRSLGQAPAVPGLTAFP